MGDFFILVSRHPQAKLEKRISYLLVLLLVQMKTRSTTSGGHY
nr:MAG TPA: hypothetical protein [Caudoviricetes sp.]